MTRTDRIAVVGVGEDGWDGLPPAARAALQAADVVVGGERQLALVAARVRTTRAWSKPLRIGMLEDLPGRIAVLASGDPMLHGIGGSLVRAGYEVDVHPAVSSTVLACARLRWPAAEVMVLSAVNRPLAALTAELTHDRRLLVLGADPRDVAGLLRRSGFGRSRLSVLCRLGGPAESVRHGLADSWSEPPADTLCVVAVECAGRGRSRLAGLPDDAYDHDAALTKAEVRAVTLAALGPRPGELLWDVGAGSGSVGIEWMRTHPSCRAVAVEARSDRCAAIRTNADALGVPGLEVLHGAAPQRLPQARPDAVFVGGGITAPGLLDALLAREPHRLVANVVTVEGEAAVAALQAARGGTLTRIAVGRAEPVGGFLAYRPAIPVTQWRWTASDEASSSRQMTAGPA